MTNLVTNGWPVVMVAVLVGLVVLGAVVAAVEAWPGRGGGTEGRGTGTVLRQRAKAKGHGSVVQVGGDVVVPPSGGTG